MADAEQLASAKKESGLPVSQIILQCIRRALPDVVAAHRPKQNPPPAKVVMDNGRVFLSNGRRLTLEDCQRALEESP